MAPASLLGVLERVILPLTEAACLCAQEGDLNMPALAKTLFEAGYKYMLMPDHAPSHPDDVAPDGASPRVTQGWAFQFGYIISVIQTLRVAAGEDWGAVRTNEAQPHHEAGGLSKL